jgi:lipopolysaccharide/colanic/teichoic acid biosynthesis glycosyltransferase
VDRSLVLGQLRERIGRGWVEELVVEGDDSYDLLEITVRAAREAGRPLRVRGPRPRADLPPAQAGERWLSADSGWRLLPCRRPARQRFMKRTLDIVGASMALILLLPLLMVIALAVRLTSPGPILYPWRVVGRNGRPFTGYKFRTMVNDADARKAELLARNEMIGPVFKLTDDPRLTRVGRHLRRHSLDELPQLWSVLMGDMSLVGPRPAFRHEVEQFELWQLRKLSVTPGLTCLWQVRGRNRIRDFAEWARLDLEYIDTWSLRLDLAILLRTLLVVVRGTGR